MVAGPENIAQAVTRLAAGGLVAFVTETVYGLGADAFNADAVKEVFKLKARATTNPLIVHVTGPEMASRVVADWPQIADVLAAAFWPGPLTLVLPKARNIPDIVTAGGPTVAVRCPDHPTALALIEAFDGPLVGPSANVSGQISPTTAEHVRASFTDEDLLVLDGGPCSGGIESTVLLLAGGVARILRPGLIGADEIRDVLGQGVSVVEGAPESAVVQSPGLIGRHYSPRTAMVLFRACDWPGVLEEGERVVVLTHEVRDVGRPHFLIAMPREAEAYAARLYAALREADEMGADLIAVEEPGEGGVWVAVLDRLGRAAERG